MAAMTTYTLRPPEPLVPAPDLDEWQQRVVTHRGGPLLVLAGPGTGKTTTMVETVVDLVERRGVRPDQILALTFSRKAAQQLRDRVVARLRRTTGATMSATFHSFAYSLLRELAPTDAYAAPLRLLSAPAQDAVIRTLLRPAPESVRWPAHLVEAVATQGFAREVQALLSRVRERGVDGSTLVALGRSTGREEWVASGRFLDQYLDVLDAQSSLDYADLINRAVSLLEAAEVRQRLRQRYEWVLVDEYQDTDPSQVALLQALAGDGRNLVVVGDPDQSVYGFRGADVRGVLEFPRVFRCRDGSDAPVLALRRTRRFGPVLLQASRHVAAAIPTAGAIPAEAFAAFRRPEAVTGEHGAGEVDVLHLDTPRAEVEHIADRLRRAHLQDGIAWPDMAVLVRSGRAAIPGLRRALTVAGVPVEVAADDTPLAVEPAVQPLLDALRVVVHAGATDPRHPDHVDADRAASLLTGPLGGMDAAELRQVAQALHRHEKAAVALAREEGREAVVLPSVELVREALLDPGLLSGVPGAAAAKARAVGELLARARRLVTTRATAEAVLWELWSGTSWPGRLRSAAVGGGSGSAAAHRDLDAICALFEEAAKLEEQRGHTTPEGFLESLGDQQLPGDTLADRGVRGAAVRLLTAHRSKGLEWRLVVVAGVQEGTWPDLRRRSTLLHADEVGVDGPLPPVETRALLAEERRLFYVACTRARERLLVTAVASSDDDGDQTSRFTAELGVEPRTVVGRPPRPLSLPGLVADLRRTAAAEETSPGLRAAAVRRLARLAQEQVDGHPVAPWADPATWWGVRERTLARQPLRPADEPVTLSASSLQGLLECPARWFLEREAGGRDRANQSQGFGQVVHTLVERVGRGELPADVTLEQLMSHVDAVWPQIAFRTPWSGERERAAVRDALARFLAWSRRPGARVVLDVETRLSAVVEVDGHQVRLHGYADRLELDEDGQVVVVDFKTTKYPPRGGLEDNPQLGLYQLAVAAGAVEAVEGAPAGGVRPGGAELVQLRFDGDHGPKVQPQSPLPDGDDVPVRRQLAQALERVRQEEFPAVPDQQRCRTCSFCTLCPALNRGTVLS
jgi:superfamily I DNA/RNA helicase/RecB family exonuclease